jgi:hypothetical protein
MLRYRSNPTPIRQQTDKPAGGVGVASELECPPTVIEAIEAADCGPDPGQLRTARKRSREKTGVQYACSDLSPLVCHYLMATLNVTVPPDLEPNKARKVWGQLAAAILLAHAQKWNSRE